MADHTSVKLGKKAPRIDPRTLKLGNYLGPTLAPPPPSCAWVPGLVDTGMMLNDKLGCCTIAGIAHQIQVWTLAINQEITVPDATILDYYKLWDGYKGGLGASYDPDSDNGGVEIDVLNRWRQDGFVGHKLSAYVSVNPLNPEHVKQAIALFGGVYIGLSLPLSAKHQVVWDVTSGHNAIPNSWGGHCVIVTEYTPSTLTCRTWGDKQDMTWEFWDKYVDECYALLSPDFITVSGVAPSGFDLITLNAHLAAVIG